MPQEKKLPRVSAARAALIIIPFLMLEALVVWFCLRREVVWPAVVGFIAFPLVISRFHWGRRRCPQCHGRLVVRNEDLAEYPDGYRLLLDCPRCDITWYTGYWSSGSL
jgi:hypothetical protein